MSTRRQRWNRIGWRIALVSASFIVIVVSIGAALVAEQRFAAGERRRLGQYSVALPPNWKIEGLETTDGGCLRRAEVVLESRLPLLGRIWTSFAGPDRLVIECRSGASVSGTSFEVDEILVYPIEWRESDGGAFVLWCLGSKHDDAEANHGPPSEGYYARYARTDVPNRCLMSIEYRGKARVWSLIRERVIDAIRSVERV